MTVEELFIKAERDLTPYVSGEMYRTCTDRGEMTCPLFVYHNALKIASRWSYDLYRDRYVWRHQGMKNVQYEIEP